MHFLPIWWSVDDIQSCHFSGTGAFIKAVEVASGREATILGKPEKFMFEAIKDSHNIDPARTIMIGDR